MKSTIAKVAKLVANDIYKVYGKPKSEAFEALGFNDNWVKFLEDGKVIVTLPPITVKIGVEAQGIFDTLVSWKDEDEAKS